MSEHEPQTPDASAHDDEILIVEDDTIIGTAFKGSLAVIALLVLAFLGWRYLQGRPEEAAPEVEATVEAPQQVIDEVEPPEVAWLDVAAASGVDFVHVSGAAGDKLLPETMGSGLAVFDYDGDGDQDLFFPNGTTWPGAATEGEPATQRLFANDGNGNFSDVSAEAGLDLVLYGTAAAVGDYDGDGLTDLFIAAVGENRLLRNLGGRFEDVTATAGVAGDAAEWSVSSAFFDYDGDQDLDLFVGNYVRWSPEIDFQLNYQLTGVGRAYGPPTNYEGTYPYLYRNEGDGRFSDVSEAAGLRLDNPATGVPVAKTLGISPIDVDEDGFMDFFLANDTVRNFFFHNQGDGSFEEVAELWGLAYDREGNATGAMGVDAERFRDDEDLGILVGNFSGEMSSIYVSQGDPSLYVDESIAEGIGAPSRRALSFGVQFFDYDLDGRLDILQANGHLEENINQVDPSQSYEQEAQLFWNAGDEGRSPYVQVPIDQTGDLGRPIAGRATGYGDLDGDGDLDAVLTQVAGPPLVLRNDQALGHHWLRLRLKGEAPNPEAIGARLTLIAGQRRLERRVMPTRGYQSQMELPVTFGLGRDPNVDRIDIVWPDGAEQSIQVDGVDRLIEVQRAP